MQADPSPAPGAPRQQQQQQQQPQAPPTSSSPPGAAPPPPLPPLLPLGGADDAGLEVLTIGDIAWGAAGPAEAQWAHRYFVEMTSEEREEVVARAIRALAEATRKRRAPLSTASEE
jgi:hypothetical protein